MNITYFINQYPHVSHTFIRREILELEAQGFHIQRISLRGWDSPIVDDKDKSEQKSTCYILESGVISLFRYFIQCIYRNPIGLWESIKCVFKMCKVSERNIFYHVVYLLEACRVASEITNFKSQHVHAHFGTNSTDVVLLSHLLTGIPFSFTVHGPEEFDKPISINLSEKIRHAKFVCAISHFGRSQLFRWSDYDDWIKIKIVRCGLDEKFLQGITKILPKYNTQYRQLLCIGRLCEQKGQLLLLQAFKELIDDGYKLRLVLAGDGDMRTEIESFIAKYSLNEFIVITGWISSNEVKQLLIESDAMILPSFAEGLPVAIMEAMAIGCPVISTYIAGIPELIINGKNGLLFPAGDIESTKSSIVEFISMSNESLDHMVTSAYDAVNKNHNIRNEASKLATLFME